MFEKAKLKKTSIMFDEEQYQLFKKICRANDSDASKELRKFIKDYIQKNQDIVMKLKTQ